MARAHDAVILYELFLSLHIENADYVAEMGKGVILSKANLNFSLIGTAVNWVKLAHLQWAINLKPAKSH